MKKLLLFMGVSLYFSLAHAETSNPALKEIRGITAYNATILGYAISCSYPIDQIEVIKNQMVNSINTLDLKQNDYDELQRYFRENLEIAKQRGPNNSKMSCEQFKIEFDKIYSAIKNANK